MMLNHLKRCFVFAGLTAFMVTQQGISYLHAADISEQHLWQGAKSLSIRSPKPWTDANKIALAELGQQIFFDKAFSRGGQFSCASCHNPDLHFTDGKPLASAVGVGNRNTPTVVNTRWAKWFFMDGRADSLVSQALLPFEHPKEQATHRYQVFARVIERYLMAYTKQFGVPAQKDFKAKALALQASEKKSFVTVALSLSERKSMHPEKQNTHYQTWANAYGKLSPNEKKQVDTVFLNVAVALSVYQRSLVSLNAPFDQFIARWKGQGSAAQHLNKDFSKQALDGLKLFLGKAACVRCHNGPMLSDQEFYNVGFPQRSLDLGRYDGLAQLKTLEFPCQHPSLKGITWISQSDACKEKPFLAASSADYKAAFKTPSLRDIAKTAPYGHHGTIPNLELVIQHYNQALFASLAGHSNPMLRPLGLNKNEQYALTEFLKSLSGKLSSLAVRIKP